MRLSFAGLGDTVSCDADGNCATYDSSGNYVSGSFSTPTNPGISNLCTTADCMATGTPLPTNPLTGQPVSTTTAAALNTLSNNSTLIVAVCAIGGLLFAVMSGKK